MTPIDVNVESHDIRVGSRRTVLTGYPRGDSRITPSSEYLDSTKNCLNLKITERGFLHGIGIASTIREDRQGSVREFIWARDELKDQVCHTNRCDRMPSVCDGRHMIYYALAGECRRSINVVLLAVAGGATASIMYSRKQIVTASKKGRSWQ